MQKLKTLLTFLLFAPLLCAQEKEPLVLKLGDELLALRLDIETIDQNEDGEVVIHVEKLGTPQGDASFEIILERKWHGAETLGKTIYVGSSRLGSTGEGSDTFARLLSKVLKVRVKEPQLQEATLRTQFIDGNPNLIWKEPVLIQFTYGSMGTGDYVSFRAQLNYPERTFTLVEENLARRKNLVQLFAGNLEARAN